MHKIFIKAYLRKNLGDDLFVKILTERYPNVKFKIASILNYKNIFKSNVKVFSGLFYNLLDKAIKVISFKHFSIEKLFVMLNNCIIWIGGSMFMEKGKNPKRRLLMPKNKDYYVIGCNFGPYYTTDYFLNAKRTFAKAKDLCFRDSYSCHLFKDLSNIRIAPDIVFSLDCSNIQITDSKKVIISVMNVANLFSKTISTKYNNKIIELCKLFIAKDYKIVLMSYCKYEGDEVAISSILSGLSTNEKSYVSKYCYNGNISEALNIMGDCHIVIGTRFHSIVLGLLFGKTVIPISYNQKTIHFLNDISFKGKYINIEKIDDFDVNSLSENDLNYKHNIDEQIHNAPKQFYRLDRLFVKKSPNNKNEEEKTKTNSKEIKLGIILSYVIIVLNILVSLIYTPVLIRMLGQSEYGLYSLVSSIISYLSILDFGFGNAIIIYTAKFRAQNLTTNEQKLHGLFFIIYTFIGVLASIIGIILYCNINNMFGNTMTLEEIGKAKILFKILIVNLALSFPLSIFSSIITAYEKFIFSKLINIIRIVLTPMVMIPLLFLGYKSIALSILITILNIASLLINMFYCLFKLHIKFIFHNLDFPLLKEIFGFSFFVFINIIIDKANWSIDNFILGSIISTSAVAVYSIGSQLNMLYLTFSTAISNVLLPRVTQMESNNASNKDFSDLFIMVGRIQYEILGLILTAFVIFGKVFIVLWAGSNYTDSYYIACILMIPMTIPLIQNIGINILQAKNKNKFRTIVLFIIAIGNVLISIPLARIYQGIGSAIGTSIAMILGNIIILNIYYHKQIGLDIPRFWVEIGKITIPIIVSVLFGYIYIYFFNINNIAFFALGVILYISIYSFLIWHMGLSKFEKSILINFVNRMKLMVNKSSSKE